MNKYQVLVVDDDKDIANLFYTVMKQAGFGGEIANTAKQALAYLAANKPDMILLDMRLGLDLGGDDILYKVRSNPRLDQTKVIVITAYPLIAEPLKSLAEFVLLKPVDLDQLKTLARRLALSEDHLEHAYIRDPVTGLYTREFFLYRLEHIFERFKRSPDILFGILAIDIEWNCDSNDEQFQADHNHLLIMVSDRIRRCYRLTDTISKFLGDQFVTLHEDLKKPDDFQVLSSRLKESLEVPYKVDDRIYHARIWIGSVLHDKKYKQPLELLEAASHLMEVSRQPNREELIVSSKS
jgi:diguanylate cyclase (GGDEF)-like protein